VAEEVEVVETAMAAGMEMEAVVETEAEARVEARRRR